MEEQESSSHSLTMRKIIVIVFLLGAFLSIILFLEEQITLVHVGDRAPYFSALSQEGTMVDLNEFHGHKNVLLYFYPKDFTAGCTQQACILRDRFHELEGIDAVVLGVSSDESSMHRKFADSFQLPFVLLSDPENIIIKAYGARWCYGLIPITKRIVYILDKEGTVRGVFHNELDIQKGVEDAVACLHGLRR